MTKKKLNIKKAIKKSGSLTATAKRAGAVKKDGTIKVSWSREKAREPFCGSATLAQTSQR